MLARLAGALSEAVRVVTDPDPDGLASPWRTYQACLASMHPEASHLVILQDDVTPCLNLIPAVRLVAGAHPDRLVTLYVGQVPTRPARLLQEAAAAGTRYLDVKVRGWCPTVALIWPRALRDDMLSDRPRQRRRADDFMVGQWARKRGVTPVATVPSLVQHYDDHPSLIGRRSGTTWRTAAHWIGTADPLAVCWGG